MGNSMTVVKVHLGDGVSSYKAPVCVMEILTEHPDYVVVSMSKGKRIILSSDMNLLPGRNYYLVSPDDLCSATVDSIEIPDHALSCCYRRHGILYRAVTICASTKSLLATLIPKCKCSKSKSSEVTRNSGAGQQSGRKRALRIKDNCTEISTLVTSLQAPHAPAPAPAGALSVISETSNWQHEEQEVWSAAVRCSRPEFLPLGHGMVAKVEEMCSSKSPRRRFNIENTGSESNKESSTCVPWKSLEVLEGGGIVSQALRSKDKWLEDMIRGADNQWKRNRQHGFTMEPDAGYSNDLQICPEPNLWSWCLPLGGTFLSSAPKKDSGYLDYSQSLTPGSSERSQSDSFEIVAVNRDRNDPQQDFQGARAKRVTRAALQSTKHLERDERDDADSRHPLWLKMDEIERQYLMRLAPPISQNALQRFPGNDTSTRPCSLKFSSVDRG